MLKTSKNDYLITIDFCKYLPSRLYILTNIFLILPLFSKMLSVKEMGTFQIGLSLLNLMCTIFFDWISKSVLRFYDEHKLKSTLNVFFNNIIKLFILNYIILICLYCIFKTQLCTNLHIDNLTLFSVMIIVLPCIIRQLLYQILRLLNKSLMYTMSIIIYQIILVIATLLLIYKGVNNTTSIFFAMSLSMIIIDTYIIKKIQNEFKIECFSNQRLFDKEIILKILKYGIPLICTNFFIWSIYHYNKYYFQNAQNYNNTGELALAGFLTDVSLTAIFSTLLFAVFPRLVKRFETQRNIKILVTDIIKLYLIYFAPLMLAFCIFPQNIIDMISNNQYKQITYILPFFAGSCFIHELGKIINLKYHLLNKTYIGTTTAMISSIIFILLINIFGQNIGIIGCSAIMFLCFVFWITLNTLINFKELDFIDSIKIIKTILKIAIISAISYIATLPILNICSINASKILPILSFITIYYFITFEFKKYVLK